MVRPISLFLFVVLVVAKGENLAEEQFNGVALCISLAIVPCLSVVATACISKRSVTPLLATCAILLSWSASVLVFSWGAFVQNISHGVFLVDNFILLLPALFWLCVLWFVTSPMDKKFSWVLHRLRLDVLLLFVPIALFMLMNKAISSFASQDLGSVLDLVSILIMLSCASFFITWILSAKPMKDCKLQKSIIEVGLRARVRKVRIYVWNTHGRIMNALAIGILFQTKTIVLTDKLISSLTKRELLAVTAHEFGHHKYWHIPFLLLTAISAMLLQDKLYRLFEFDMSGALVMIAQLVGTVMLLMLVSRQFEEQADAYAAVDSSRELEDCCVSEEGAMCMESALGVIAHTQNIHVERNDFLHGSIASRQAKLQALIGCPFIELPINKRVFWLKMGLGVSLVVGILI
ncbi:MAG: hypothetical protein CMJ26_05045 [Phycisphaerae bacterium]|nr:hypothetical protein [Phycisphaerae bacterium]|tara:strand:+ start:1953 stop:3167 length:1215 start_codon:yes stop_codon:yes gene_type:complete